MNKCCIALVALLYGFLAGAQAPKTDPVHFTFTAKPAGGQQTEIHLTATLDEGWHLYAQVQPPEAISMPTQIIFTPNPLLIAPPTTPKEVGTREKYTDETAGIVQYQYGHTVDFVQTVRLRGKAKTTLNGTITYQVCTSEMCLPPKTVPFRIPVP